MKYNIVETAKYAVESYGFILFGCGPVSGSQFGEAIKTRYAPSPRRDACIESVTACIGTVQYIAGRGTKYSIKQNIKQ